ncbi:MAG: DUF1549 and DUF1553 domain-containing protein [Verrucomicrobiaceae bacterium]|nr:DUF1549 and DUF1553 domain-containing protein [Verrucomicrobiaceae bacterium]
MSRGSLALGAAGLMLAASAAPSAAQAAELRPKGEFKLTPADHAHWAFQPLKRPAVPAGENGVDFFIRTELSKHGLTLAPRAAHETLLRRVHLDLVGLPPSDPSDKSDWADMVERLLDSPRYGERWGRHWLDLVRFAESDGFEHDEVRPNAWRYRDYVVQSFNDDKPYDRFIREQLAGDELWPADPQAVIATGFALLGPDMVDSSDQVQRRHNTLNDVTDTTAMVFLGLTMTCARCHDHKFEPLSQRDYYSLQAFFNSASFERSRPVPTPEQQRAFDAASLQYNSHSEVSALAEIEAPARAKLFRGKTAKLTPEARAAHETPPDQRTDEQINLVLETASKVKISDREIAGALSSADKEKRERLLDALKKIGRPPALPAALALDKGKPRETFILRRGEYSMPLDPVQPGSPEVIPTRVHAANRRSLADWIASPCNPLTARVMVNRIWQHHFGRGLVATPSDFGTHGSPPTHPGLLDWLASEFIANGWSVKHMHRVILNSETYQQGPQTEDRKPAESPAGGSGLLSSSLLSSVYCGFQPLRLEGEVIRDSLLAISGKLNLQMGGPGVFPPVPQEVIEGAKGGWNPNDRERDYNRRSLYIFARRNLRFPFLEVFDAPDNNLSCPSRERSTTAPQALTLLNAREVTTAANATAGRLRKDARTEPDQIALAYRFILCREPKAEEKAIAHQFLNSSPLDELCRALFNLNEFVYAE